MHNNTIKIGLTLFVVLPSRTSLYRGIYYAKYYGEEGRGMTFFLGKNKGERKKEKNYLNNGGKGLKNASFWEINPKNFRGGVFRFPPEPPLPQTYSSEVA